MNKNRSLAVRRWPALAALLSVAFLMLRAEAQTSTSSGEIGLAVLTRGVLHEGFAQPLVFHHVPAEIVPMAPPDPIEEELPEYKPRGENVGWIPGYWSWDGERNDYVWTSGFWRQWPKGRDYVPGYWIPVEGGWRRVSGFWISSDSQQIQYLPDPPRPPETGTPREPPQPDVIWIPGHYAWQKDHFIWSKGYWWKAQRGWIWVPPNHIWTPAGFVLVGGYWDYPVDRRGLLFAPVSIPPDVLKLRNFYFRPRVVIDSETLLDCLFCDVKGRQYRFGDYYKSDYLARQIYPWFEFHRAHGYDPLYEYYRWLRGGKDAGWQQQLVGDYRYRTAHEEARPSETFLGQRSQEGGPRETGRQYLGRSLFELAAAGGTSLEPEGRGPASGQRPGPILGGFDRAEFESRLAEQRNQSGQPGNALAWQRPQKKLTASAGRLLSPDTRRAIGSATRQSETSRSQSAPKMAKDKTALDKQALDKSKVNAANDKQRVPPLSRRRSSVTSPLTPPSRTLPSRTLPSRKPPSGSVGKMQPGSKNSPKAKRSAPADPRPANKKPRVDSNPSGKREQSATRNSSRTVRKP